tara:strand:- start:4463 stop:5887 length:1425 start_codon:yes stop_codon:yes gene_type:complete
MVEELGHWFVKRPFDLLDSALKARFSLVRASISGSGMPTWSVFTAGREQFGTEASARVIVAAQVYIKAQAGWNSRENLKGLVSHSLHEAHAGGVRAYVGDPCISKDELLLPAILVDAAVEAKHKALSTTTAGDDDHEWVVARSLIESTAWQCLDDLSHALSEARDSLVGTRGAHEILRAAGAKLISAVVAPANGHGGSSLFESCVRVSTLPYERAAVSGTLLIASQDHECIERLVSFTQAIEDDDIRMFRKLLETCGTGKRLLCDGNEIYGIGEQMAEATDESVFEVSFCRHGIWSLLHADQELMRVDYGLPGLPQPKVPANEVQTAIDLAFPEITTSRRAEITALVTEASDLEHGTVIVISDRATEEARLLGAQAVQVDACGITAERLSAMSRIDGAILLGEDLDCHAFGVVLDGLALEGQGSRARGARYNSAFRYLAKHGNGCLVVVVSDDGMVNVLPQPPVETKAKPRGGS